MGKNSCGSGIQHMARELGLRAGSGTPEPSSCLFFWLCSKKPNSVCLQINGIVPQVHLAGFSKREGKQNLTKSG